MAKATFDNGTFRATKSKYKGKFAYCILHGKSNMIGFYKKEGFVFCAFTDGRFYTKLEMQSLINLITLIQKHFYETDSN